MLTFLAALAAPALAQHGTAPPGYYPMDYNGDTFTGVITATNPATNEVTLVYTKGTKQQTFTGVLPLDKTGAMDIKTKDGKSHKVTLTEFAPGLTMTAYYTTSRRKVAGKKIEVHTIIYFQIGK